MRFKQVLCTAVLAVMALAVGMAPPGAATADAAAQTTTSITVNGTGAGPVFGGVGAASGGGGNSRLLLDYPEPERSQILDYLFKPDYGASLQMLKVEIGGDTNSTDGSESSIEHTKGSVDCNTGYEWWLMEQAKARNPAIQLYALAWGAPGWIGSGNFWSTDMINYLISWLGCATSHGLTINYLGGWNEKGYSISWFEQLRTALNTAGYGSIQLVGADDTWSVASDMLSNSTFDNAIAVIGDHYPCGHESAMTSCPSTADAVATGKPLWASENGSLPYNTGGAQMARGINRDFTDGGMTADINWPVVAGIYDNEPYNTDGLILADQPWSGSYSVGEQTWVSAQTTQFTSIGWHYINSASGYLGGSESNGTYVTLKSTNGTDYSTVIETTTATAAQTADFTVSGGLSTGTVHVWATNLGTTDSSQYFVHTQDITPVGGAYSITLQPGYVYTLTTTTGQSKGTQASPPAASLALPYTDSFNEVATGSEPVYFADQQGSFESQPCGGGRSGQCLRQMAATQPIEWDSNSNPYTMMGNLNWSNYTVSTNAMFEQAGSVILMGRVGVQAAENVGQINAYELELSNTGTWSILRNSANSSTPTTLATGTVTAPGLNTWEPLALSFTGSTITASINGTTVGSVTDATYATGLVGLGTAGYQTQEFSGISVTPNGQYVSGDQNYELVNRVSGKALDVVGASSSSGALIDQASVTGAADQLWQIDGDAAGWPEMLNVNSGAALDDPAWSKASGTQLNQWTVNGGSNQGWQLVPASGGYYTLVNQYSGLVAADANASTSSGAPVVQETASGASEQDWSLVSVLTYGASYTLANLNSGMDVDVTGASTAQGASVIQWPLNGGANQVWTLKASSTSGQGVLVNANSGQCLDVSGFSTSAGTQLEQWPCNGGSNQAWQLTEQSNGSYVVRNVNSGLVLDVSGSSTAEDAAVVQNSADGAASQEWTLSPAQTNSNSAS